MQPELPIGGCVLSAGPIQSGMCAIIRSRLGMEPAIPEVKNRLQKPDQQPRVSISVYTGASSPTPVRSWEIPSDQLTQGGRTSGLGFWSVRLRVNMYCQRGHSHVKDPSPREFREAFLQPGARLRVWQNLPQVQDIVGV